MTRVVYDLSRLSTRVLNATPNGIDWIDRLLADHFLESRSADTWPLLFGPFGPRLFAPGLLPNPTAALERQWDAPAIIPDALVEALQRPVSVGQAGRRLDLAARGRPRRIAAALGDYGLKLGADPRTEAPEGAVYLNATHYPLESARHVAWLDARPDVKPVFFIHDLLPVATPETFWRGEPERHARRLALLARRGAGAVVTSGAVAADLAAYMRKQGRFDLPILQAHPPVAPVFRAPCRPDPRLANIAYFVACGTIEPRKNHLLLAEVWRRLVARHGPAAPRLVVVGKRGWKSDEIVAALADPALGGAIVEVGGLSNGGWRALLAGAAALLAPSFAEGFGLPLAEALAAGTPALCSDIPAFREIGCEAVDYLDPRRATDWAARIAELPERDGEARARAVGLHKHVAPEAWLPELDGFLSEIAANKH